jgi:hypothetical protein
MVIRRVTNEMACASAHPTARTEAPPTASGLPECHWGLTPAAPVEGGPLSDADLGDCQRSTSPLS